MAQVSEKKVLEFTKSVDNVAGEALYTIGEYRDKGLNPLHDMILSDAFLPLTLMDSPQVTDRVLLDIVEQYDKVTPEELEDEFNAYLSKAKRMVESLIDDAPEVAEDMADFLYSIESKYSNVVNLITED